SGTGANRSLRLDFPGPVAGAIEVTLELVPRGPWRGPALLTVPRPQGNPVPQVAGHLAYRVQGGDVNYRQPQRLVRPEGQGKDLPPFGTGRTDAAPLSYAYTIQRSPEPPLLTLDLRPRLPRVEISQQVRLHVGSRQASWEATVELNAPDGDLSVLEWEIR